MPNLTEQDILEAFKFIDKNGVPKGNQSKTYDLVTDDGKKYPPEYVLAVADHLANNTEISVGDFSTGEGVRFLKKIGFKIESKSYTLTITAESAISTNECFTTDDLGRGDNYKPLAVYLKRADGSVIRRDYKKNEKKISNKTMPLIACQVFEKQLDALSSKEKEDFPICKNNPDGNMIKGIFSSTDEYHNHFSSMGCVNYEYGERRCFVFHCWNLFSTLNFVQECLKRFGKKGDEFVLTYTEKAKEKKEPEEMEAAAKEALAQQFKEYRNPYSSMLIESKNLIFRGAPGTGKSYLAKQIAADIISNGEYDDFTKLTPEQQKQVEFVQFHPSYDYTDFVEGLKPKYIDGTMNFELKDGVFKRFVARARKNYENSQKSKETIEKEISVQEAITGFFTEIELGVSKFKTLTTKNEFVITGVDDKHVNVYIPKNPITKKLSLNLDEIRKMLDSEKTFEKVKDITEFFGKTGATQEYSYELVLYKKINEKKKVKQKSCSDLKQEEQKYIFIIDEINRGEISKIFGELFYAIDPGYRGKSGEISTQYSSSEEKFYVPENVYIIGTMNDIDRSVDSFDFAMRRRFRFVELKAEEQVEMLQKLNNKDLQNEAIRRMNALNKKIVEVEDLDENYQIGAAYFLKLKKIDFDQLWTDYLKPLLQEYIRGLHGESEIMDGFEKAYGYPQNDQENVNK